MSQTPSSQIHQHAVSNPSSKLEEVEVEVSEGMKDEPPDQSGFFDESKFNVDAFTTSSLHAAASAVLAGQSVQSDLTGSIPEEELAKILSSLNAMQSIEVSDRMDNSRSSSIGRPSLSSAECSTGKDKAGTHSERHMWTPTETRALVDGCNKHGIGNWKAILNDKDLASNFNGRTPGDLKDRFRTYFPDAYHELYPNAKTHTSRAVRSKAPDGKSIFEKGKTKERRPFTAAEDEVLRKGYQQFGSHWAIIAKDAVFEGRRKSTDLRDRFRNAFPSLYEQAGYKPRTKSQKKERRQSSGSFSHTDKSAILHSDWPSDSLHRPNLQSRSETSTSAHSQAVSEHSELSEEDESSDALEVSRFQDLSDSARGIASQPVSQSSVSLTASRSSSALERSPSYGSTMSDPSGQQGDKVMSVGLAPSNVPAKIPQVLRRTQSTKRANYKIGSLDQAVKAAYSKSSKEAVLASHQQHHMQQLLQQQRLPTSEGNVGLQRPTLQQSVSAGWPPRFAWLAGGPTSASNDLANMDLDQMDEIMNSHSATELLSGAESGPVAAVSNQGSSSSTTEADEVMNVDEQTTGRNAQQPDFASLYQQLALASNDNAAANRALSIESFQDLLDPVLPLSNTAQAGWDQSTNSVPWTPVSSATAALSSSISENPSTSNATRREHEHNQWAGDLLHRGSYSTLDQQQQQTPQGFVSMASMHLSPAGQSIPTSRSADDNLGQQRNNFSLSRPLLGNEQLSSTMERPLLRPPEQGAYSTPSVHELISRSARRQSYPPRPVGFGEENEDMMQSAYSNPYPYPADDISLLNSSAGGSLTLFPSLVNSQVNDYSHGGMMRRRRSTDTLREGAYSFTPAWRGGLLDSARQVEEQEEMVKEESVHGQRETASISSHHGTSEHSRSISDVQTNIGDDDDDAPSRAASVGNLDLVGQRNNGLYAESLPDLSSGIDDHAASSSGDAAFSHHHNLQNSFDDMDLPSFLNRSPNFLHSTTTATTSFSSRSGNQGGMHRNSTRAWSASGTSQAARPEDFVPVHHMEQRRDVNKGASKSVDLTSFSGFVSPFGSNPMKDAGALDRLEHLYLEGLHTPSSPLHLAQGVNVSGSAGGGGGGGYGNNSAGFNTGSRVPLNNPWWTNSSNEKGDSGYESV